MLALSVENLTTHVAEIMEEPEIVASERFTGSCRSGKDGTDISDVVLIGCDPHL